MVETRSQKASEDERRLLELEIHPNPALDDIRSGRETYGNGNRKLISESTPVEQGRELSIERKCRNVQQFN